MPGDGESGPEAALGGMQACSEVRRFAGLRLQGCASIGSSGDLASSPICREVSESSHILLGRRLYRVGPCRESDNLTPPHPFHRKSTKKSWLFTKENAMSPGCSIAFPGRRGVAYATLIPPQIGQLQKHPIDPLILEGTLMVAGSNASPAWIRVCAWCGVVLPGPEPGPESAAVRPVTTHGICPPCRDAFLRAPFDEGPASRPDATGPR